MWKNRERSVDLCGVFGLSIMKHVTSQKIVAHDFQYNPLMIKGSPDFCHDKCLNHNGDYAEK
jgi:hypothetical protein